MKLINIFKAAIFEGSALLMLRKLWLRAFDKRSTISEIQNLAWLKENTSSIEKFCKNIDEGLWNEIQSDILAIKLDADKKIKEYPYDLGGGGAFPLLYFLIRHSKPEVVIETGVAAGYSSYAILHALDKNKKGHLFSSDFPYFRLPNPKSFIGAVVPEELKYKWSLFIKGDTKNLPAITKNLKEVDLFHYDSDKSYDGRSFAMNQVSKKLHHNSWIIMDDISDNGFFYDHIKINKLTNWKVFAFEGKWLGLIFPEN